MDKTMQKLGRRSFIDPICCNFSMVLFMFFKSCPAEDTWYDVILRVLGVLGQG